MSATLFKSKVSLFAFKALDMTKTVISQQVGPAVKDLLAPTTVSLLNEETTNMINTSVKIYATALAFNANEHVFTRHVAKLALVAPKGSPLQTICSVGMSSGWLVADKRGKAFLIRAGVTGMIITGYTLKLRNLNKESKHPLAM